MKLVPTETKAITFLNKHRTIFPDNHKFTPSLRQWCELDFQYADIYLPSLPGIYVVRRGKVPTRQYAQYQKILYIGISNDLRSRFMSGHHRFYEFLREGAKIIRYCPFLPETSRRDMELVEAAYINYHTPLLNRAFPKAFSPTDRWDYHKPED